MIKHKILESILIIAAIFLIITAAILIKNPTIAGYSVQEEYIEYTDNVNLETNISPILLENKKMELLSFHIKKKLF